MVATRLNLHCPNGHPKTVLVSLDYIRETALPLELAPTRCGVCGVEFEVPAELHEELVNLAQRTAVPV